MRDLDHHKDQTMALSAFRYCLDRRSYVVGACQEWVRETWDEFGPATRAVMVRDLAEGLEANTVGDDLSVMSWRELLAWMRQRMPDNDNDALEAGAWALLARLRLCADDPKYATHSEVPKPLLHDTIRIMAAMTKELERLR